MLRIWRLPERERLAYDLSSLRIAFHMAAPCARWLKAKWIGWLGAEKVLELYGGTELQAMTIITGTEWLDHEGSVGKPVLGEIECRDPDGAALPPRAVGELWMRRGASAAIPYRYVGASAKATCAPASSRSRSPARSSASTTPSATTQARSDVRPYAPSGSGPDAGLPYVTGGTRSPRP